MNFVASFKNDVVIHTKEGVDAAREWLQTEGKDNITALNEVIERTAISWHEIVEIV